MPGMPTPFEKKPLLNRAAQRNLQQAGLGRLAEQLPDIDAARQFAFWRGCSGAEVYLLTLVTAAARRMALHYFSLLDLKPGPDRVGLSGITHSLPELGTAYQAFLHCYPSDGLAPANEPGTTTEQTLARRRLLAELFILDALLDNPAASAFHDLFDDSELREQLDYRALLGRLAGLAGSVPADHNLWRQGLPELLRAPMRAAPHSLVEQMAYIVRHWAAWLPVELIEDIQLARAVSAEENRPRLPGPGPSPRYRFGRDDGSETPASFTADIDWMTGTVLLAKSVYVWLDQLASRYRKSIATLAEIPDEELARLASWGFNALWLIGLWERSAASKRIKQLCGNPEAEASAYALHAYRVAADLGGEAALADLERRCRAHGIRLACDVVPNHTGIDSEWLIEHPDWFLQAERPPYPAYSYSGPDLCDRHGVSIRIEDGYWDHRDAAVVFEHHDHGSGRRRYIYHGNDGTHMPWNDTAQLNFLLPEVRRAMSDLILAVARRFSVIRFDAAMTLARKHYRRLWFPPPGGSAGVPSRSTFCLTDADFDAAFPTEFWREVVDRVNREAPDTLLIAEAFWLMESYFVRNLGMHRVYNSAFMNMLKREENAKYRQILKDILAYNPEILKRYVNFMNNPDEATAVEQFDKGDKYFGVATLLATLPGLPMFGHGQIEGYREKYGMEYRRAYWQEEPDHGFVAHHERQVFPLLCRRHLFAGVEHFSFYDFTTDRGVDENVYAYSNGPPGEKVLVVFNNAGQATLGRLHHAAPKAVPEQEGAARPMPPLNRELGLLAEQGGFCRFRSLQGLEYLVPMGRLHEGLELELQGYQHLVFSNFRVFEDHDGRWHELHRRLQGRPVADLDRELLRMLYQPQWQAFVGLLEPNRLQVLAGGLVATPPPAPVKALIAELAGEVRLLAELLSPADAGQEAVGPVDLEEPCAALSVRLAELGAANLPDRLLTEAWLGTPNQPGQAVVLLAWLLLDALQQALKLDATNDLLGCLHHFGLDIAWQESATTPGNRQKVLLTTLLLHSAERSPHPATDTDTFAELVRHPDHAELLGVNRHAGEVWFSREAMSALVGTLALQEEVLRLTGRCSAAAGEGGVTAAKALRRRLARAAAIGYRLDKFLQLG